MGVKKSTVWTSAWLAEILYTPASSAVSKPTRTLGSCCRANFPSTLSSTAGLSLDAQPAAFTDSVRRNDFTSGTTAFYAQDKKHSPHRIQRGHREEKGSRGLWPLMEVESGRCACVFVLEQYMKGPAIR